EIGEESLYPFLVFVGQTHAACGTKQAGLLFRQMNGEINTLVGVHKPSGLSRQRLCCLTVSIPACYLNCLASHVLARKIPEAPAAGHSKKPNAPFPSL